MTATASKKAPASWSDCVSGYSERVSDRGRGQSERDASVWLSHLPPFGPCCGTLAVPYEEFVLERIRHVSSPVCGPDVEAALR
jgi:hypothetical protein